MLYQYSHRLGAYAPGLDPDAKAYIAAVEAADGQALEPAVRVAYDQFIRGCKTDGIWDAIKASCILAGARTLSGALVPLKGTAPTNFNFVSGDYNRETGLIGDGSTKYLDSNRSGNTDPQDNCHISIFASSVAINTSRSFIGTTIAADGQTVINGAVDGSLYSPIRYLLSGGWSSIAGQGNTTGFKGSSRPNDTTVNRRSGGVSDSVTASSGAPTLENFGVFARTPSSPALYSSDRLAFYSIGEALDLAALDSRISTLISDIAAAIP